MLEEKLGECQLRISDERGPNRPTLDSKVDPGGLPGVFQNILLISLILRKLTWEAVGYYWNIQYWWSFGERYLESLYEDRRNCVRINGQSRVAVGSRQAKLSVYRPVYIPVIHMVREKADPENGAESRFRIFEVNGSLPDLSTLTRSSSNERRRNIRPEIVYNSICT